MVPDLVDEPCQPGPGPFQRILLAGAICSVLRSLYWLSWKELWYHDAITTMSARGVAISACSQLRL
jgi:hypothetical protein